MNKIDIAMNHTFLAKLCNKTQLETGIPKYFLNLFDESGESVFMLLIQDHEPIVSSKLEESTQSVYDSTLVHNNTTMGSSLLEPAPVALMNDSPNHIPGYVKSRKNSRIYQESVHEDATSPFPIHEEVDKYKVNVKF